MKTYFGDVCRTPAASASAGTMNATPGWFAVVESWKSFAGAVSAHSGGRIRLGSLSQERNV